MSLIIAKCTSATSIHVTCVGGDGPVKDVQTLPQADNRIDILHPGQEADLTGVPNGVRLVKYWTSGGELQQTYAEPWLG